MATSISNMSGRFLVAAPGLEDPNFRHTVVLICEHSKEGAFGLIVNRVLMNSFRPFLKALEIEKTLVDLPVYYGGPVKPDQGYIIYSPCKEDYNAIKVTEDLAVTASKEILFDIAAGRGPEKFLFTIGFSGWAPSQLEDELMIDSWLVAPLDSRLIFELPAGERWKHAAQSIGIDPDRFIGRSASA